MFYKNSPDIQVNEQLLPQLSLQRTYILQDPAEERQDIFPFLLPASAPFFLYRKYGGSSALNTRLFSVRLKEGRDLPWIRFFAFSYMVNLNSSPFCSTAVT